jgi:hypothetical protein
VSYGWQANAKVVRRSAACPPKREARRRTSSIQLVVVTCVTCGAVLTVPGASPDIAAATPAAVDPVSNWNVIALQAAATAGESAIVQSRTLAIVQVAIHDR